MSTGNSSIKRSRFLFNATVAGQDKGDTTTGLLIAVVGLEKLPSGLDCTLQLPRVESEPVDAVAHSGGELEEAPRQSGDCLESIVIL